MKKVLKLLTATFMTFVLLVSCGKDDAKETKTESKGKVAVVFATGGLGDESFNDSTYKGLELAKEKLGVDFDYYEPKDPSAESQNQLQNYAEKGEYDLIIGVGYTMRDSLSAVAKEFPEQKFALIDDEISDLDNVASLMFREEEGTYLAGALAAMMTKTNSIGVVGAADAPVVQRFESGFYQGARAINPDIDITTVFINGPNPFKDPVSAKALTNALIQKTKSDVILHVAGGSGIGVFQAAKENGIYAIGVDADQDGLEPGIIITSMIKKSYVAVFKEIEAVLNGEFKSGIIEFGIAEDGVGLSEMKYTKDVVGEENIKKLDEIKEKIKNKEIKIEKYLNMR